MEAPQDILQLKCRGDGQNSSCSRSGELGGTWTGGSPSLDVGVGRAARAGEVSGAGVRDHAGASLAGRAESGGDALGVPAGAEGHDLGSRRSRRPSSIARAGAATAKPVAPGQHERDAHPQTDPVGARPAGPGRQQRRRQHQQVLHEGLVRVRSSGLPKQPQAADSSSPRAARQAARPVRPTKSTSRVAATSTGGGPHVGEQEGAEQGLERERRQGDSHRGQRAGEAEAGDLLGEAAGSSALAPRRRAGPGRARRRPASPRARHPAGGSPGRLLHYRRATAIARVYQRLRRARRELDGGPREHTGTASRAAPSSAGNLGRNPGVPTRDQKPAWDAVTATTAAMNFGTGPVLPVSRRAGPSAVKLPLGRSAGRCLRPRSSGQPFVKQRNRIRAGRGKVRTAARYHRSAPRSRYRALVAARVAVRLQLRASQLCSESRRRADLAVGGRPLQPTDGRPQRLGQARVDSRWGRLAQRLEGAPCGFLPSADRIAEASH
jgi:hypothetical protein